MRILMWGLLIPATVLLLQISLWRIRRPANDLKLLTVMLVAAMIAFLILCAMPNAVKALMLPEGLFSVAYAAAVASAVSVLYLITYFGLGEKSPSTLMVEAAHTKPEGLSMEEASALFTDEEFIVQRVRGLIDGGQMVTDEVGMRLTAKGRLFMEAFVLPRRIMGLKHWGG